MSQPRSFPLFREAQSCCPALAAPWQVAPVPAVTGLQCHCHRVLLPLSMSVWSPQLSHRRKRSPWLALEGRVCTTGSVTAPGCAPQRMKEMGWGIPFLVKQEKQTCLTGLCGGRQPRHARSPSKGSPAGEQPPSTGPGAPGQSPHSQNKHSSISFKPSTLKSF